jgi:hypothetical protein
MIEFAPKPGVWIGVFRSRDGLYTRDFSIEAPPYRCTVEEWNKFLYPSGLFELMEKTKNIGVGDAARAKEK